MSRDEVGDEQRKNLRESIEAIHGYIEQHPKRLSRFVYRLINALEAAWKANDLLRNKAKETTVYYGHIMEQFPIPDGKPIIFYLDKDNREYIEINKEISDDGTALTLKIRSNPSTDFSIRPHSSNVVSTTLVSERARFVKQSKSDSE